MTIHFTFSSQVCIYQVHSLILQWTLANNV